MTLYPTVTEKNYANMTMLYINEKIKKLSSAFGKQKNSENLLLYSKKLKVYMIPQFVVMKNENCLNMDLDPSHTTRRK